MNWLRDLLKQPEKPEEIPPAESEEVVYMHHVPGANAGQSLEERVSALEEQAKDQELPAAARGSRRK